MTAPAVSSDSHYNGLNPADVSVTNTDNDVVPSTKFYVVNDSTADRTYEYSATGVAVENYALNTANTAPRGVVSTAAGDKVWVRMTARGTNHGGVMGPPNGKSFEIAVFDVCKFEEGKIVEHWDVLQVVPAETRHANGMF